jgi:ribonuclease PH
MSISATSPISSPNFPVRPGGRAASALRPIRLTPDFTLMAEGSVLIECGQTRVLCTASVEQGVPGWRRNSGQGWVTAEYGMLPRATLTRTAREAERGKVSGRTQEIQRLIGRSLRTVVDMTLLGERTVVVDCDVLQAYGGTRTAAITGASAALSLALTRLTKSGMFKQNPMREHVAATSVGILDGAILLDLCYEEDSRAEVDANVVMTASGGLIEVQSTAERAPFSRAQMETMLDVAAGGITELLQHVRTMEAACLGIQ